MNALIECVPNFSEGRRKEVVEQIVDVAHRTAGVQLLDYSSDEGPQPNRGDNGGQPRRRGSGGF